MATAQETPTISTLLATTEDKKGVDNVADKYLDYFEPGKDQEKVDFAVSKEMTSNYYDIVTDFYEYGWGESFHFALLKKHEKKEVAFRRHELWLAEQLSLKETDKVLDLGCGVGGPARNVAREFGCHITGLNINKYQLSRCRAHTERAKLTQLIDYVEGDFTEAPFESSSFDKIYAIEATCHCPVQTKVYAEAFRLLKPGGLFGLYDWCMTDKFDPTNKQHQKIKEDILLGDGLPDLRLTGEVAEYMRQVGFELVAAEDVAVRSERPWEDLLKASWRPSDFKNSPAGRFATRTMLRTMEKLKKAPKGTVKVHKMLCRGADGLVKGGETGIFTPMYFMLGRKPEQ